jgi:hypothetical protein
MPVTITYAKQRGETFKEKQGEKKIEILHRTTVESPENHWQVVQIINHANHGSTLI